MESEKSQSKMPSKPLPQPSLPAKAEVANGQLKSALTEADIVKTVNNSWKLIDQQCQTPLAIYKSSKETGQPFPEVRIFVSSTFTDFHAEREILVKHVSLWKVSFFSTKLIDAQIQVFPKLKDECTKHGISLIPTDLR